MLIWLGLKKSVSISYRWPSLFYTLLAIWALFDGIILSSHTFFQFSNHLTQGIRLLLGVSMFLLLPNVFKSLSVDEIIIILKRVLIINLWIQICYIFLYPALGHYLFNIISSGDQRAALIAENAKFFNHFIIINTQRGYPQFSGIFDEPAWFGWNLNLIIAILLQFEVSCGKRIFVRKDWIAIIVSYLSTFSLSAIGGLLVIWVVYYLMAHKGGILKTVFFIVCILSIVLFFINLNPAILSRLTMISQGGDGSATARFIGSWNALCTILSNNPITGYGLGDGNMASYFSEIHAKGNEAGIMVMGNVLLDIHIIIVQIVCNLGIIGAILYLAPILSLIRKGSIIVCTGLITVYFSVNVFNSFFLFFMTALALYCFTAIYHPVKKSAGLIDGK